MLTAVQAASVLGVSTRYVTDLALKGQRRAARLGQLVGAAGGDVEPEIMAWLDGRKVCGVWQFERTEIERFDEARKPPRVVVAYDVTFSFEKSISLAWVHANTEQREIIEAGLKRGVAAGLSHLEGYGLQVRNGRGAEDSDGLWAAAYLHLTNRSLEPQLHVHAVVVNAAANSDGDVQAIDARSMFREATAAGYLAGAETRSFLSEHLGVEWDRAFKGTMEVAGVPKDAMRVMSSRRDDVLGLAGELGFASARSRRFAALATRAPKQHPEDFDLLVKSWRALASEHQFSVDDSAALDSDETTKLKPPAILPATRSADPPATRSGVCRFECVND